LILVDTTPLVALCDPRDPLHERALLDLGRVKREPLAVCESVLTEACFLLQHATQRQRLARLLAELPVLSTNDDIGEFRSHVFTWLNKYADQDPDWADGVLVVLSARLEGSKLWTYDTEFWTVWRNARGKRLSLFVDPRNQRRSKGSKPK
jgi:predicted nucleic acid-binding protein